VWTAEHNAERLLRRSHCLIESPIWLSEGVSI
jgi:hypothetical protein